MREGAEADVFEVFARYGDQSEPIMWVGNVRAADPTLAWHAAKEIFTRREKCTVLWVACRSAMAFSTPEDSDVLATAGRLDYRKPGFPGRHRRDREKAASAGAEGVG
jgi:ring-1,2-phenylacetyl-CoA epoxidase subunit PaaB